MKTMNNKAEIRDYCKANKYFKRVVNLDENIAVWIADYNIDILRELKGLNRWCIANPKKLPQNIADFLLRNLDKAEQRQSNPSATSSEILKQLGADLPPSPPENPVNIGMRKKFLAEQAQALKIRNKK